MSKLSFDLQGRTALVTGGFSGLGLHFARVLAEHGARVPVVGRRLELGRSVASSIGEAVGRPADVRAYAMDVTDPVSVRDGFAKVVAELGVPSIVVNNAGKVLRGPSEELADPDWTGTIDLNLNGVFRVAQAAAREMMRAGQPGTIINIASVLGIRLVSQVAAYTTTKAAVIQLTKALALEWAGHGIRVNALAPGYFETDLTQKMLRSPAGQALIAGVPQKRTGELHELDGPLLLLASDASAYMTGAIIPVDGGHLLRSL